MEQFQDQHGNYPEMIAEVLGVAAEALGIDVEFVNYDVEHGTYPTSVGECDGYVISGSRKSAYDDEPWIHALIEYTRTLHAAKSKTVGICFGHQIIADALGGKTLGAEAGWGVGIQEYDVLEPRWFMEPAVDQYTLIASHKDQVAQLPEGAELLASSDHCPNSMYVIGDHILTMQGHPEFVRAYSAVLMDFRRDLLGPDVYTNGIASLDKPLMREVVACWIMHFFEGPQ